MSLSTSFYQQGSYDLAIALLGKVLCLSTDQGIRQYRIVETEAYGGITDKAAHSYNNKRTPRTEIMYAEGGHVYVYFIYGMHYMLNIVASVKDNPEAVLIRALEPLDSSTPGKLTNGPAKLCKALGIDKRHNGLNLCISNQMFIIDDGFAVNSNDIIKTTRINVDYAQEDKDRPWRFYLKGNPYVSKK